MMSTEKVNCVLDTVMSAWLKDALREGIPNDAISREERSRRTSTFDFISCDGTPLACSSEITAPAGMMMVVKMKELNNELLRRLSSCLGIRPAHLPTLRRRDDGLTN